MTRGGLERMLASWLPAQRWFAGSGATVRAVEIISDVMLGSGEPSLRHLIVGASIDGEAGSYQVPLGIRAELPAHLVAAAIGTLPDGRACYDAMADPELTTALARGIASGQSAGPITFAAEPGAVIDTAVTGKTLPQAHSNTSVVFGDHAILKLLRRPVAGAHPDLEVPSALSRAGSRLVAAPLGWIELAAGAGVCAKSGPTVLAIMSRFFAGATDGWTAALHDLRGPGPDFTNQARELGEATATLHAELAGAFGTGTLTGAEMGKLADGLLADLERAVTALPQLAAYQAGIAACYAGLKDAGQPVVAQRIHGDYHLAQVLATAGGWIVLDFEGEPSVPLERRVALAPALRDVAGMLRSFDYAAGYQALGLPPGDQAAAAAANWAGRCKQAFLAGYAEVSGTDPMGSGPLLRALIFSKAVYEAVYEVRHRPDWLPIPLAALAEARDDSRR